MALLGRERKRIMEVHRRYHGDAEQVRHTEWERGKSHVVECINKNSVNLSFKS